MKPEQLKVADRGIPTRADAQPESLEALFQALESPLLAYAFRLLKKRSPAEDIVQEAFLRLHAEESDVQSPRRWLFRTVHNLALNHLRKFRKIVPFDEIRSNPEAEEPTLSNERAPDQALLRWEAIDTTRRCLERLTQSDRELLRMKFEEKQSYKEISQATGLSVGNVGYRLHHAIKALSAELRKAGVDHE